MDTIKHDSIYPNPDQPRQFFHPDRLNELAQSIKENGLIEPIVVVKKPEGFMIVAGERRWRACGIIEMEDVPVSVIEASEQTIAELALVENLQREDLNEIEEAQAYQRLMELGLTKENIATKMGMKNAFRIDWRLSLLNLKSIYQDHVIHGLLTPTEAREMARLPKEKQDQLFDKIRAGKADGQNKLTSLVNAMLSTEEQTEFFTNPTEEEIQTITKYDAMISKLIKFINASFDHEDLTVLSKLLSPQAQMNIDRIDLIITHLKKIKNALMQSASATTILDDLQSRA